MDRIFARALLVLGVLLVSTAAQSGTSPVQITTPRPVAPPFSQPLQQATPVVSQAGHEYAPLLEQTINYKDWTFNSIKDGKPINLREWAKGKKLILVVYFAPWCGNWKMEAPGVAKLYEQYKQHGFDVIGVSEYAAVAETLAYFNQNGGAPYTVVSESDSRESRDKTSHYGYRQLTGDTRKWGSPYNIFLEPSKLTPSGEILTEKAWVVGGELIEKDVERFIRERLGLTESAVAPCEVKK